MTTLLAAMLMARLPADVSLDFASPKGLVVFQAEGPGGAALKILLDTGARRTVVDTKVAEALKLTKGDDVRANGVGGAVNAHFVKGLNLSSLGEPSLEAVALPLDAIGGAIGSKIDLILGQDVLGKHVVEIDPRTMKLTFGTRPAIVPAAATVVSLHTREGRPYLMATVVGSTGEEMDAEMLLDTGSDAVTDLAQPFADEMGLSTRPDPQGRSFMGVGGSVPLRIAELRGVRVGREVVSSSDVRVVFRALNAAGDGDGRVGSAFLGRYRTIIDGPGKKLVLAPIKK